MSNRLSHHPEDEQLLRYADGELPARRAANIRSHLEVCWECRSELQELQNVIGECVKYRKEVLQQHLPTPPAPWADLYRRFDEIDASLARRSFMDRIRQALRRPAGHARQWALGAAVLALILAIVYQYSFTPSVEAAELLRKASAAAQSTPPKARRLQIRTGSRRFIRPARFDRQLTKNTDEQASVAALFQAAHYSWEDPLSASSYQAWRDQLSDKRDAVATLLNGYRIETSSRSSELTEATLTLSVPDLVPVEGRFVFRNHESVEIIEAVEDAPQSALTAAAKSASLKPAVASAAPPLRHTAGDELHILSALHELGADLGDPIDVKRSEGEILVTGVGVPVERQQQIQEAVGSKPNVVFRFSDAATPPVTPQDTASQEPAAAPAEDVGLRNRMEAQLGGRTYVEQLTKQVLSMSESMMARAYALRRLAEQMPSGVEAELSEEDRQLLLKLDQDHTTALAGQETGIERVLSPVLTSLGAPDRGALSTLISGGTWQSCTQGLFQPARRLDKQIAQMLGVAAEEGSDEQLPAAVRQSLIELRASLSFCSRLTAQALGPPGR